MKFNPLTGAFDIDDSAITVQEVDGSPSVKTKTIKFTNGTVTDNGDGTVSVATGAGGGGDFSGPASSTDNAIVRFDGAGGKTGQNSGVTIADSNAVVIPAVSGTALSVNGANPDSTAEATLSVEMDWDKKIVLWGDVDEGYTRIEFRPERRTGADAGDVNLIAHRLLHGTSTEHKHLSLYTSNAAGTPTKRFNWDYGADVADFEIQGSRVDVNDPGDVMGSGVRQFRVYNNTAQTDGNSRIFLVHQDNASATAPVAEVTNDGTGIGLRVTQNGAQTGAFIDQNAAGKALFIDQDDTGSNVTVDIDRDGSNAAAITGLQVDVDNASTGGATGISVLALSATGGTNAGIKVLAPTGAANNYALQLADTGGTTAGGITFGTDTSLHRSAANVLTLNGDLVVSDEAYDATSWNGSNEVPTKNAVRDKIEAMAAGSGITRTVVVTSGSATMGSSASTDYVYFVAGAHTMSLPAASGNTNRYTVKNNHSAAITIDTAGAENVEGAASLSLQPNDAVDLFSDGTNWYVV